jgi:predicted aconitase
MYLSKDEKKMIDGHHGEGVRKAMEILVAIGEAFGAERMIDVSRVHVALSNQEADLWFVETLLKGGAACRVAPTTNPPFNLEHFEQFYTIDVVDKTRVNRTRRAYRDIGAILTYNCTPYLEANVPRFGERVAFSESSATVYTNSVLGARSNRESAQSALASAITGKTPEYGLHLEENRKGEILIKLEADLKDEFDYGMLGYYVPQEAGFGIPVFIQMPSNPTPEQHTYLGAMMNTSGAVGMYHIVGVTPEAPTLEAAFNGKSPKKKVLVTDKDLEKVERKLSSVSGKIDFVLLGCPHYTITQIREVARLIEGRTLHQGVSFWICASSLTRELARRMGYLEVIERAGGQIVSDTCIDQPCWRPFEGKRGITDSPKCAYYTKRRHMEFTVRRLSDCVKAAIEGGCE